MHVLPLPFGLALAVIPRREADKLRDEYPVRDRFERPVHAREQLHGDVKYLIASRHII